jgi:hypothetical protein
MGRSLAGMRPRFIIFACLSIFVLGCSPEPAPVDETGESGETGECLVGELGCPCGPDDACAGFGICVAGVCEAFEDRLPYRDSWREELVLPAAGLERLIIGGRTTSDNFANRGDIEILYVEDSNEIRVELQRFTFSSRLQNVEGAFARMSLWAYALDDVVKPTDSIAQAACSVGDADFCHLRTYFDGLFQPLRDGANIRVSVPRGWSGALELETEDNLEEGEYLDRGDVLVDGLAGHLQVQLDSGRALVRLDPSYDTYPGCPASAACVAAGFAPDCGCTQFGSVQIEARSGQAADILVDVPPEKFYSAVLDNDDSELELGCSVEIECETFPECDLEAASGMAHASINHPGSPALPGAGIHIVLHSGACATIVHAESPTDYIEGSPSDVRGSVRLCSGCSTGG